MQLTVRPSRNSTARRGSLILESLLGIALLSIFLIATITAMVNAQEQSVAGGDRVRASAIAQRSLEVGRLIRSQSFSSLPVGTHGVWLHHATNRWTLSGSSVVGTGGYINSLAVSSLASDWKLLSANVKWKHGASRSGAVLLTAELTNWRAAGSEGDWGSITADGSISAGASALFTDVVVSGNYAIVAGDDASGGDGLYIYDVTTTSSPTRVNTSFNLGHGAIALALRGKTLYVMTDDTANEIKIYSLTGLPSLAYRGAYNLPGSARGTSLSVYGSMLYAGATYSATAGQGEFFAFNASNSGSLTLTDDFDASDAFNEIAVTGSSAYVAAADNSYELSVVNVESSGSLAYATGQGVSVTGSNDGMAVTVSGTSAILGIGRNVSLGELAVFDIPQGGVPSAGPYHFEMSGSVLDLAPDAAGCYVFAATQQKWKALRIVEIDDKDTPVEASYYTLSSGQGRAVFYDMTRDRLFFVTDTSLYIFRPGAATGSC